MRVQPLGAGRGQRCAVITLGTDTGNPLLLGELLGQQRKTLQPEVVFRDGWQGTAFLSHEKIQVQKALLRDTSKTLPS